MTPCAKDWTRMAKLGCRLAAGVSLALLAACSNPAAQAGGAKLKREDVARYAEPVARSQARERALAVLADAARGPDAQLRANAVEALQLVPSRLEPIVRAALADENLGVRFVAAMTAGRLRMAELAPAVRPLLQDASPSVRAAAIFALVRLGETVDRSPLADYLLGPDMRLRAQAAYILGELGDESASGLLREGAKEIPAKAPVAQVRLLRLQIAEALVKLGDSASIETIRAALYPSRAEDLEATALAVQIIGQVQDRRSIDQLIYLTALEGEEKMPAEVRLGAAAALAQLGLPQGAFIADEHFASDLAPLRAQAAFVYGETGGPASLAKLDRLMEDHSPLVRVAAAAGAIKLIERDASGGRRAAGIE